MTSASGPSTVPAGVDDLIARIRAVYLGCRCDLLESCLRAWPDHGPDRIVDARPLPVLRWLDTLELDVPESCARVITALRATAARLAWRQTYTVEAVGAEFLDHYAYTELIGERGPVSSRNLACGLLLLGPGTRYPRHRHDAAELYVPLSGTASWQQGDGVWRERQPGTLIHHASNEPHAMRVGAVPLLAAYLWYGGDVSQPSTLS